MKEKPDFTLAEIQQVAAEQRRDDGPGTAKWHPDGSAVQTFNAAFIEEFRGNGAKIDGKPQPPGQSRRHRQDRLGLLYGDGDGPGGC